MGRFEIKTIILADSYADAIEYAEERADDEPTVIRYLDDEQFYGEATGVFCEGCEGHVFPGIRWPTATNDDNTREWVERCDVCERYTDDFDAARALAEIYEGAAEVEIRWAYPVGMAGPQPFASIR